MPSATNPLPHLLYNKVQAEPCKTSRHMSFQMKLSHHRNEISYMWETQEVIVMHTSVTPVLVSSPGISSPSRRPKCMGMGSSASSLDMGPKEAGLQYLCLWKSLSLN